MLPKPLETLFPIWLDLLPLLCKYFAQKTSKSKQEIPQKTKKGGFRVCFLVAPSHSSHFNCGWRWGISFWWEDLEDPFRVLFQRPLLSHLCVKKLLCLLQQTAKWLKCVVSRSKFTSWCSSAGDKCSEITSALVKAEIQFEKGSVDGGVTLLWSHFWVRFWVWPGGNNNTWYKSLTARDASPWIISVTSFFLKPTS